MNRALTCVCTAFCALTLNPLSAHEAPPSGALPSSLQNSVDSKSAPLARKPAAPAFRPFTGKVKGKSVRMRLHPDLESQIIRELERNELLCIVGEKEGFYAVEPPPGVKAYVFRSFVLDDVVEGNHVNVRLEPHLESPIIGHLNSGDKIDGHISATNSKWYEINPPGDVRFYVSKEFIENIGGLEVKYQMDKRRATVEQLLDAAALLSKAELRKPFEEIDIDRVARSYNTIIKDYTEFPERVHSAKEALAATQEAYLQKRLSYLEERASAAAAASDGSDASESANEPTELSAKGDSITDRMKLWEPVEEALFLAWAQMSDEQTLDDFYDEQMLTAAAITGIVEAYSAPVKNKPGDFLLKEGDLPTAYLYSAHVNLQNLVGKKVTLLATERPNNNFAFPAYYVLSVE